MSTRPLVRLSLAMIAVAVAGFALFYTLRAGLPPAVGFDWPTRDASGRDLDLPQQAALVREYRTHVSASARFLAGPERSRRFDAVDVAALDSTDTQGFDRRFNASYDTQQFFDGARFHATTALVLFGVLFVCGLLGLLRLKVRGVVAIGGGILVLALLGGGAILYFTGAGMLAGVLGGLMLVAFFGQLIAANLLPDANHPWVVAAEDELRALPPERRRRHILVRMIAGIGLTLFGAVMTALSMAIHAGVVVVATGAIAGGLGMMVTPILAAIRMRAAPRV